MCCAIAYLSGAAPVKEAPGCGFFLWTFFWLKKRKGLCCSIACVSGAAHVKEEPGRRFFFRLCMFWKNIVRFVLFYCMCIRCLAACEKWRPRPMLLLWTLYIFEKYSQVCAILLYVYQARRMWRKTQADVSCLDFLFVKKGLCRSIACVSGALLRAKREKSGRCFFFVLCSKIESGLCSFLSIRCDFEICGGAPRSFLLIFEIVENYYGFL